MKCPINIIEKAIELSKQIKRNDTPLSKENEFIYFKQRADNRHNSTNYEDILNELPLCQDAWDNDLDLSLIHISEPTRPY